MLFAYLYCFLLNFTIIWNQAGVWNEAYHFKEALRLGEVKVAYGRVMLIGEAGVGKSTLLGALMNQPVTAEATSTIMADTKCLKCQWKRCGTGDNVQWYDITEEDEIKELAVLVKQVMNTGSHSLLKNLKEAIAVNMFNPEDQPLPRLCASSTNISFQDETREVFSKIVADTRSLVGAPLEATEDQYLNLWNCGGQRVFLDVLPAFLTSRTIFLLMFDASKDLQGRVDGVWNQRGISTSLETLNISRQDLMVQWMSCIYASLSNKAEIFHKAQHSQDEATVPPFPRIVIIETHGDKIDAQKKNGITSKLRPEYDGKPFSDLILDTLILDSSKSGSEEDPAITTLKQIVKDFILNALCIPTPIAWVLFRKLLTKLTKSRPIVTLYNVATISRVCSIEDTAVLSVLRFYHELGVFLHYADIEKLEEVVIAQPEWLVKHLGTILAPKESGKDSLGPREAWRLLREKGILVEALYQVVWKTFDVECEVKPQAFADLLEHCFLIGKIIQGPFSSVPRNYGKMYFIPCVLPICPDDVMATPHVDAVLTAAPLHFRFSSKCVPPGFFVRLAAVLSTTRGFSIDFQIPIYSNRITFQFGDNGDNGRIDDVIISETKFSIRVDIARVFYCSNVDGYNFPLTCRLILKLLLGAAHELYKWFPCIEIRPEFQCKCPKGPSPHFAVFSTEAESSTTLRCEFKTPAMPTAEQQLWMTIPSTVDKEGVLYQIEIEQLLKDLNGEAFHQLSKTLEMDPETISDNIVSLCQWSCKMGSLARSHLVYHLRRIGRFDLAKKIDIGHYPKYAEGHDQAHDCSVVSDEELVSCSRQIGTGADLSILAAHLGIPASNATNTPLDMLKKWKEQHKTQAYKKTLIKIFTDIGRGFENASRLLSGDGAEKPDMKTVMQSIGEECAPKWYDLGLQLCVPASTLHIIEKDCPNNCQDAMRKMIQEWLQLCSNPTWRIVALSLRNIHMISLANCVERKYC